MTTSKDSFYRLIIIGMVDVQKRKKFVRIYFITDVERQTLTKATSINSRYTWQNKNNLVFVMRFVRTSTRGSRSGGRAVYGVGLRQLACCECGSYPSGGMDVCLL
jgi:hypothetical protein